VRDFICEDYPSPNRLGELHWCYLAGHEKWKHLRCSNARNPSDVLLVRLHESDSSEMLVEIVAGQAPKTYELICYFSDLAREQKLLTFTNTNEIVFSGEDIHVA
jgi:hypothetical protein